VRWPAPVEGDERQEPVVAREALSFTVTSKKKRRRGGRTARRELPPLARKEVAQEPVESRGKPSTTCSARSVTT